MTNRVAGHEAAPVGASPASPTVLHLWPTYVPGHDADLHWELLSRSLCRSILLTEELIDNGAAPYPNTFWLERVAAVPGSPGWIARFRHKLAARGRSSRLEQFIQLHLREHEPQLLHVHFGTFAARLVRLLEHTSLPVVVSLYGVDASAALQDPACLAAYRRLFELVGRFVVLSDIVRQRLEHAGCPPERIAVWDMPLDFAPYPFREPNPGATIKLLTAARFVEKKGYPMLLEAVRLLKQQGCQVSLTAIGYGPLKEDIRHRAARLGLASEFTIIDTSAHRGFSELYSEALRTHDVFVLPSTQARNGDDEGGPALSLVMAQAAGLPVVCTPFTGSERSVVDGETGLLCKPDDPQSLADTLAGLIGRPDTWSSLAWTASQCARQRFDKSRQVDAMAALYRSLVP
jgi:colanic acid/amylovoran biosynthesis glycosyltransferase